MELPDDLPPPTGGRAALNPRRVPIQIPRPSRKRSSAGAHLNEAAGAGTSAAPVPVPAASPSPRRAERDAVQATAAAARDAVRDASARRASGKGGDSDNERLPSVRMSLRRRASERDVAADALAASHLSDPDDAAAADESAKDANGDAANGGESPDAMAERHARELADLRAEHQAAIEALQQRQAAEAARSGSSAKRRKVTE